MIKRVIFWIMFLVLVSFPVSALDQFETEIEPIKDTILPDEIAEFELMIKNNQNTETMYKITKPAVYWDWNLNVGNVIIGATKTEYVQILLEPFMEKIPGDYGISLNIKSTINDSAEVSELFEIKVVSYDQAFSVSLDSSENINPNKENLFRVIVRNNYDLDVQNLSVNFHSEYFDASKSFDIRPYETVEVEIPVEFDGVVTEGDNTIYLDFYREGELVLEKEKIINIGYFTDVSGIGTPEESFLYNKETVVRTNTGNTISHETYMKKLTLFEKLFTSTNPGPDSVTKDDSFYILEWSFDLEPDQTKTIVIETNYRWFTLAVILIVLLLLFLFYWLKRDVSLGKKIVSMRKGEDGFYSLNVILSLKNKTLKKIYNVKVMDRLSGRIDKVENFGVHNPSVVKSDSGKTARIIWNIKNIGKREEILLQYTIRYKPYVIRSVPPAIAKYLRRGRPIFVKSNRADIFN